ncbi:MULTISPECIES: TIGR01458 family HAD-type hydrolase [Methylomonas]|uniref:TIGR01458 family HAD-type hydrolase n=1 Tax=Methylomonas TaxID=416 RepID=UPI001231C1A5|nr:TIGR01458 family HAD-type hydrolase [Methylomonas rhizoryzae]
MLAFTEVRGMLFDLDGVFFVGCEAIPGGAELLVGLKARGIPYRFVTNTTTLSRANMAVKLQAMNLPIQAEEIISAPYAALLHLRRNGYRACQLLLADQVCKEFSEFSCDSEQPQAVVIGDIGSAWSYALLNQVFQRVMAGSELIALHKGKFWQTEAGLQLDIGAFVTGLEYATGKAATVIGKPSPAFFSAALAELDLPAHQVAMVGDDIDSDVGGAQQAGLKGMLVKTGKYREAYAQASGVTPDATLASIADLRTLI